MCSFMNQDCYTCAFTDKTKADNLHPRFLQIEMSVKILTKKILSVPLIQRQSYMYKFTDTMA